MRKMKNRIQWYIVPLLVLLLGMVSVSAEETPSVSLPQKGDYLYQAVNKEYLQNIREEQPVEIILRIDHMGAGEVADITDPDTIQQMVDLFCEIRIGDETQEWVTDNYNGVQFIFADGTKEGISLNLKNLELSVSKEYRMYELVDLDPFWNAMSKFAVPEDTDAETAAPINDLYQVMENDDIRVEVPAHWIWGDEDGLLFASKNGDENEPWLMVMKLDADPDAEGLIAAWKKDIRETYQNRLAFEPESYTFETETGRTILGLRCQISSEDGMSTSTLIDAAERIGDGLYGYGCAYISQTYRENEYEDETTYFDFEHMMESMELR